MSLYPEARFITSAARAAQFITDQGREVAFAGRSNAGKSSAINAIINRHQRLQKEDEPTIYKISTVEFNAELRTIQTDQETFKLSPKEADLLRLLCKEKNKVLPRDTALTRIWGETSYFTTRSMDVYITKLRKYLKDVPGVEIINIHGSGYLMKVEE